MRGQNPSDTESQNLLAHETMTADMQSSPSCSRKRTNCSIESGSSSPKPSHVRQRVEEEGVQSPLARVIHGVTAAASSVMKIVSDNTNVLKARDTTGTARSKTTGDGKRKNAGSPSMAEVIRLLVEEKKLSRMSRFDTTSMSYQLFGNDVNTQKKNMT